MSKVKFGLLRNLFSFSPLEIWFLDKEKDKDKESNTAAIL